jgi:16S rRNA C1402 N4-methylase RsmH
MRDAWQMRMSSQSKAASSAAVIARTTTSAIRALHAILDNAHRERLYRDIAEAMAGVRNAIARGAEGSETALR